jgi:hypothetical protein
MAFVAAREGFDPEVRGEWRAPRDHPGEHQSPSWSR